MLTEERYSRILECLKECRTISVAELVERLGASEATIRRDLNSLASMSKIKKVRGGATVISDNFDFSEHPVEAKEKMFADEKDAIAKYAADTIRKDDFIYIDAGTTTEKMIDYIKQTNATFVTNGVSHAKKLARKNLRVYEIGGRVKSSTEAVVDAESVEYLRKFNFTKCYMGTNGISILNGLTTPDAEEAIVKKYAIERSYISYVLADHSKFNKVTSVTFAEVDKSVIITDYLPDKNFLEKCIIKEVAK